MKKKIAFALRFISVFLLLICLALTSLHYAATNTDYHLRLYRPQHAAEAAGLTDEGVARAAKALTDCLRKRDTSYLKYEDEVYGTVQPVFNEREIAHMEDVAGLFRLLRGVVLVLTAVCAAAMLGSVMLARRDHAMWHSAFVWGAAGCLAVFAVLALLILPDFDAAFMAFHRMFFTNDLWLMDPETDLMIRLLPESFFEAVAGRVALLAVLWPVLSLALGFILKRRDRA